MGLAASQARFLAITSRKADCEYRSMVLAQEQLSISRELEAATEDYENSINATTLAWDMDGTGEYVYDLSYNTLMSPSEANKYTPYLLSRSDGKLAVTDDYTSAMKNAISSILGKDAVETMFTADNTFKGLCNYKDSTTGSTVKISDETKKAIYLSFLQELQGSRSISTTQALAAGAVGLKTGAGLGEELMGRETSNQMYLSTMVDYINLIVENTANGYYSGASSQAKLADKLTFCFDYSAYNAANNSNIKSLNSRFVNEAHGATIMINGNYSTNTSYYIDETTNKYKSNITTGAFTLADLLEENVTLVVNNGNKKEFNDVLDNISKAVKVGNAQGSDAFGLIVNKDLTVWYDEVAGDGSLASLNKDELGVLTFIDQLAKGMYALLMPEEPTDVELNAFYTAMADLIDRFRGTEYKENLVAIWDSDCCSEKYAKSAATTADKYNCWVYQGANAAISLSNMTETFLTNFCNGMDAYTGDYGVFKDVKSSYYVTDDDSYIYTINNGEDVNEDLWCSEFYSVIFNLLCQNGSYTNSQIEDKDYLQNAIKNGQLFVVSQSADNYFYQSRYAQVSGDHIFETSDTEAIAQAEREYTIAKSKINVKEEKIELEIKQLDLELSSLNTEYDTVKNLISTNVQKVFSLFQSS